MGPIGLLCLRRSLTLGMRAGFTSGLGAASADCLYGLLAAFGIGAVASAMQSAGTALAVGGGLFLIWLGWKAARDADPGHADGLKNTGFTGTCLLTVKPRHHPLLILSAVMASLGAQAHS